MLSDLGLTIRGQWLSILFSLASGAERMCDHRWIDAENSTAISHPKDCQRNIDGRVLFRDPGLWSDMDEQCDPASDCDGSLYCIIDLSHLRPPSICCYKIETHGILGIGIFEGVSRQCRCPEAIASSTHALE